MSEYQTNSPESEHRPQTASAVLENHYKNLFSNDNKDKAPETPHGRRRTMVETYHELNNRLIKTEEDNNYTPSSKELLKLEGRVRTMYSSAGLEYRLSLLKSDDQSSYLEDSVEYRKKVSQLLAKDIKAFPEKAIQFTLDPIKKSEKTIQDINDSLTPMSKTDDVFRLSDYRNNIYALGLEYTRINTLLKIESSELRDIYLEGDISNAALAGLSQAQKKLPEIYRSEMGTIKFEPNKAMKYARERKTKFIAQKARERIAKGTDSETGLAGFKNRLLNQIAGRAQLAFGGKLERFSDTLANKVGAATYPIRSNLAAIRIEDKERAININSKTDRTELIKLHTKDAYYKARYSARLLWQAALIGGEASKTIYKKEPDTLKKRVEEFGKAIDSGTPEQKMLELLKERVAYMQPDG